MSTLPHIHIRATELAGFMAAALLVRRYPHWRITLDDARVGGYVADEDAFRIAHPALRRFNRSLGLSESKFIVGTQASIYLGDVIQLEGCPEFPLVFGDVGTSIEGQNYFDIQRALGVPKVDGQHCFPARLIEQNRFLPPDAKGRPVLSDFDYGYQFDPSLYADMLLAYAIKKGLELSETDEARLKIHATGYPIDGYSNDWSPYGFLGISQTQHSLRKASDTLPLAARLRYSEAALDCLSTDQISSHHLCVDNTNSPCGHNSKPWREDTLRLGLSQARMEPLLGGAIHAIVNDLERLLSLMPPLGKTVFENEIQIHEAAEYNRLTDEMYRRMRDFQSLPHAVLGQSEILSDVSDKIELFAARGRMISLDQDDMFADQWPSLLIGLGVIPKRASRLAQAVPAHTAHAILQPLVEFISKVVQTAPIHADFIGKHCPAAEFLTKTEA